MKFQRDAYSNAIDKVRSAHHDSIPAAHNTMVCPRCGTKQVVNDTPGMRTCLKCGFEFRPASQPGKGLTRR
ncbi:MAG: hypothetical protein ABSG45_04560 [Nitrososphaerales archaeon]